MSTQICQNLPASDPSAKAVLMPPTVYENLRMIANAVNNMVAGGALQITKGQEGIAISYLPSPEKSLATITGNATASGMYTIVGLNGALNGNITGNTAGNWTAGNASGGVVTGSDLGNQIGYGLLLNFGESGNCGHSLPAGLPVWGWLLGYSTDGKHTPIVAANVAPPGLIPVTLTQDGGADGNGTAACSWTYTPTGDGNISIYYGNGTVVTGMSPSHNRLFTKTVKATRGAIWRHGNGTLELPITDEIPNFAACT